MGLFQATVDQRVDVPDGTGRQPFTQLLGVKALEVQGLELGDSGVAEAGLDMEADVPLVALVRDVLDAVPGAAKPLVEKASELQVVVGW
jgi:hypothetical protein